MIGSTPEKTREIPKESSTTSHQARVYTVAINGRERRRGQSFSRSFPSYEVVLDGFHFPFGDDRRHVARHVLLCNMTAFERYFCKTGLRDADLEAVTRDALALDDLMAGASEAQRVELQRSENEAWRAATGPLRSVELEMKREERIQQRKEMVDANRKARARISMTVTSLVGQNRAIAWD